MSFTLVFSFHRQQWEELRYYTPRIDDDDDDDDDGYDSPLAIENWDAESNEYAAFLDHRRMWAAVITELGMLRPLARVEKEQSLPRLQYTDHRWMCAAVMGEMVEAVKARNARRRQRPTKLIDRRGRSLPRLHFN